MNLLGNYLLYNVVFSKCAVLRRCLKNVAKSVGGVWDFFYKKDGQGLV